MAYELYYLFSRPLISRPLKYALISLSLRKKKKKKAWLNPEGYWALTVLWCPPGKGTNLHALSLISLFLNLSRAKEILPPHPHRALRTGIPLGIILLRRIKPMVSNSQGLLPKHASRLRTCWRLHDSFQAPPPTLPWWGKNWWATNSAVVWPKAFQHNTTSLTVLMPQEYELEITFPVKRISSPSDPALAGKCVSRLQSDLYTQNSPVHEGLLYPRYEAKLEERTKQD